MKTLLLILALSTACAQPSIIGPFTKTHNHSDDLLGGRKPGEWGVSAQATHAYKFHPPAGYRVRLLSIHGDTQGFIRNPSPYCAGAMWAIHAEVVTPPQVDEFVDPTLLFWVQDAACRGAAFRDPVDRSINQLLRTPEVISKVATFLNETGQPVHIESSFTLVYQFEREVTQ
jgi:hypothetical protein